MTSLSSLAKQRPPLERETSKAIQALFRSVGGVIYETPQGYKVTNASQKRTPGIPDLLVFMPKRGILIFWEVKRTGQKLSAAQRAFRQRILEVYTPGAARDVFHGWGDLEAAKQYLRDLGLLA